MHIGIDVGGTKIEIIVLDKQHQQLYRKRVETPVGDYAATLQVIINLIHQAEAKTAMAKTIGIGIPGTLSPENNKVKNANSTCLIGKPLKRDLEKQLARPLDISNDANCFVMSEYFDGAATHAQSAFGVILGTGVGGGLIYRGQLIDGPNGIGGEWGHNCLPWPTEQENDPVRCYCGLNNCIETYLSGPGFSNRFALANGRSLLPEEIINFARQGDPQANEHLQIYCQQTAKALAQVINIFDPEVIVLGGGMSNIDQLYAQVPKLWGEYIFSDKVNTQLLKAVHGDSSGVIGAACLYKSLLLRT